MIDPEKLSVAELIRDVADPAKATNAQLADDMRICFAWYSTIKEGKQKFKLSGQDVISLAKQIYAEIEKRKQAGKMKHDWNPEDMKPHSKELFDIISKSALQISHAMNSTRRTLSRHRRDNCMICNKAPEFEVLWAEGFGHAWFCKKHLQEWATTGDGKGEIISVKEVKNGEASRRFGENKSPNLRSKCVALWGITIHLDSSNNIEDKVELEKRGTSPLDSPDGIKDQVIYNYRSMLPIYPGTTSEVQDLISLDEFLAKWTSFTMRKPFISLVGSLANWQETLGDIDILVKARDPTSILEALDRAVLKLFGMKEEGLADLLMQAHNFIHTDSLFLLAKWRIERAFPEWQDRLQILDDSFSGPFTNFVELADLSAVAREEKKREEMSAKKLKLFDWFPMLKPIHGRKKEEIYSIDSVIETIKSRKEDWFSTGIYVEQKFDGVHSQVHKSDERVKLFTEEGTEITKNCPTLVKELKQQKGDFILCGELELWKEGKHQPRADTAGVLNAKEVHPDETYLRFNAFDCLYRKA